MKRLQRWFLLIGCFIAACAVPAVGSSVPVFDTGVNPETWVVVPAGDFLQGQHLHPTTLDYAYEIMATDVTNAQYASFLNAAWHSGEITVSERRVFGDYPGDPFHGGAHEREIPPGAWVYADLTDPVAHITFDGTRFGVASGYENHPATLVSWFGAWGYCRYYGWRLPSDLEWEKAARGTDDRPFPWGHEVDGAQANFMDSGDPFEVGFEGAGGTTPVGFYGGRTYDGFETLSGISPYGLHDMAGNVWQWTGNIYEGAHYRSLRGGSHTAYGYNLRIWTPNNADPEHMSPTVGFRCARDQN